MTIEYFDEARHVRTFEIMRQIHIHVENRNGMLHPTILVSDNHRMTYGLNPYPVDRNTPGIG